MKKKYLIPVTRCHTLRMKSQLLNYSVNSFRTRQERKYGDVNEK